MTDKREIPESPVPSSQLEKGAVPADELDSGLNGGEEEYPSGFKLVAVVIALVLTMFLASLDMTIVATAIPRISDDFHSLDQIGWYGSAFFLTVASFQSTWGKTYKYFALKPVFLWSIFIFEVGSLICAVSQNSVTLIVGRAITGLGAAGVLAGCYTIIAFAVPPTKRPAFTGILGAVYGVASVVGPLLGGAFTDKVSWRWCFYINLPIGGVSAFIILLMFTTPKSALYTGNATLKEKLLNMDPFGTVIIMGGTICYLLAIQWGGVKKNWNDSEVIGTLVGFGLLVIVFIVVERLQGDRALLAPRLLRQRTIYIGCAFSMFLGGCFFVLLYYLPIYFQSVSGVSAAQSGIRNLPLILAVTLFSVFCGGMISKFGQFVPFLIIGSAITTVGAGLIYSLDVGSSSGKWIGYQALAGIGIGLCFQTPIMAAQATVGPEDVSSATAILLFFQTLGGAFCVSAAQSAFSNQLLITVANKVTGVDPAQVLAVGATGIRSTFTPDQVVGILEAYMTGLRTAFALAIALGGIALPISLGAKWINIKGKI